MPELVLNISTIDNSPQDFDILFALWEETHLGNSDIAFNFHDCTFLRPNAVVFLGGLAKLVQSKGGKVRFLAETMSAPVFHNLVRNGFASEFFNTQFFIEPQNTAVPYRQFWLPRHSDERKTQTDTVWGYLTRDWLGRGWVRISDRLKNRIAEKTLEIFMNAFDHSQSSLGVFTCGQLFPRLKELKLCVVDFGIGIPESVKRFSGLTNRPPKVLDAACLEWAFQRGNSTKAVQKSDVSRGVGLDILKEFIKINKGKLEIYSNHAYGIIDEHHEQFYSGNSFFAGTVLNITVICDENYYRFSDEDVMTLPF